MARHLRRVRLRRKMGEDLEGIVLAWRKRGLASNFELYFLLANHNLFNAPRIGFSRNRLDIQDETVPKMCAGPGVVCPLVIVVRGSSFGRPDTKLLRLRFISKVHAEIQGEEAVKLAEDGGAVGASDPSTEICTANPCVEDRCFVFA